MFKYIKYFIFILLLFNFIYISNANTATINAKSCSRSDVQAAINSASNGDTVVVPSGESTWTSYVNVTTDGLLIQGAGAGSTIIHRFGFRPYHGIDDWRITGFTFDGDGVSPNSNWSGVYQLAVSVGNGSGTLGCKNWRIDHNVFVDYRAGAASYTGCYTILIRGYSYGVIDNNTFKDCRGEVIVYSADGEAAFNRGGVGGYTNGSVFVEDNTFELTSNNYGNALDCIDGSYGSRFTFRYNIIKDTSTNSWVQPVDDHGKCSSPIGSYSNEVYENTCDRYKGGYGYFVGLRGGRGVIYNNTITGSWTHGINLTNVRSYSSSCGYGGLCKNEEGYPCDYQINNLYIWHNTDDGSPMEVYVQDSGDVRSHIQQNRDYFLKEKPGYTPYPYPHPLTRGSSSAEPKLSPPEGLIIQQK